MEPRIVRGCAAAVLALILIVATLPAPALSEDLELDPAFADDPIPDIWAEADGTESRSGSSQSWIWGPRIRAATHEPYRDSPDGFRAVYYFDKARMEITNPGESWDSIWYATSGLLIREMMLGQIQIGHQESIDTQPATIPVTGDLENNDDSPTYATMAEHTSLADNSDNRAEEAIGSPVTAMLNADGSVDHDYDPPASVEVAYFDELLGHNVPDVFWDWMNDQQIEWEYVIGHPVTEAYWVETLIDGEPRDVLVQAFERRVLTFNPANDPEWQVEAGNAGLHYRAWRGLVMPEDASLHALAHGIPYGEIIVDAAVKNGVDPYLLAGVAEASSGFDPAAELSEDRAGLLGVPLPLLEQRGVRFPLDPTFNARVGADLLAMLYNDTGDWESAVEQYLNWQDAVGTFAEPAPDVAGIAIDAWQEMRDRYEGQPSPFGIGSEDDVVEEPGAPEIEAESEPPPVEETPETPEEPVYEVDETGLRFIGSGEAAHYGKEAFPVERMEEIMDVHTAWEGGAIPDWEYDPNGYYCVHPDFMVGERLHLTAPNGETFWCTIVDYVQTEHQEYWRGRWAIEVNWDLFEAMGVPYQQTIEVRAPVD